MAHNALDSTNQYYMDRGQVSARANGPVVCLAQAIGAFDLG